MTRNKALLQQKLKNKLKNRAYLALLITVVFGFGLGVVGLVNVGIIHGSENKQKAEAEQLSDKTVSAQRGVIYDTNMNVLAQSADAYKVYINPSKLENADAAKQLAKSLSEILKNEDYATLEEKCLRSKKSYVVIASELDNETKKKIETLKKNTKGYNQVIGFEDDVTRYYPYDHFASTLIGFTGDNDQGLSGLEYYYNGALTGTSGRSITAKNARQGLISSDYETHYAAEDGSSLKLTIDQTVQYYLDSALSSAVTNLKATYGYGVVMDTETGAILAMSSQPDYDLNNPYTVSTPSVKEELDKIENDEERKDATSAALYAQWRNRTITDTYEPGSVFKCITAAAGIEEGVVSPDEEFVCTGSYRVQDRIYHCSHTGGHGREDFTTSLANSCNPIYIEVAQRLTAETFYKYFEAFGFTETTGVDLPAEVAPKIDVTYHSLKNMRSVQLASSSFGQTFQVTPIQMIAAINAIANDGKLMKPYIVDSYLDADGNIVRKTKPEIKRQVVSKLTADTVTDMMVAVIEKGTAANAYVPGYNVAGKTGTSEKLATGSSYYIGSFCGFAPADDPKVTVLIAIDEPKGGHTTGGSTAAPIAAEVIEKTLKYYNVEPEYTEEEAKKQDISTPKAMGLSVETGKKIMEDAGFTVFVNGKGTKVLNQTPAAGKLIPQGGVVVLYTDSKTATKKVTVPNFVGMDASQARYAAKAAGLNIQIAGNTSGSSYKQSVASGTKVAQGSVITVSYMNTIKEAEAEANEVSSAATGGTSETILD